MSSIIIHASFREVNVTLPNEVKSNGTLFAHIMLGPKEKSPSRPTHLQYFSTLVVPLTKYRIPSAAKFNLITGEYEVRISMCSLQTSYLLISSQLVWYHQAIRFLSLNIILPVCLVTNPSYVGTTCTRLPFHRILMRLREWLQSLTGYQH